MARAHVQSCGATGARNGQAASKHLIPSIWRQLALDPAIEDGQGTWRVSLIDRDWPRWSVDPRLAHPQPSALWRVHTPEQA